MPVDATPSPAAAPAEARAEPLLTHDTMSLADWLNISVAWIEAGEFALAKGKIEEVAEELTARDDAALARAPAAGADPVAWGSIIHQEAQDYEFRGPEHTPNDFERTMLEDFGLGLLEQIAASPAAAPAGDAVLPCDVKVQPATVIRAGCTVSTLLLAIEQRRKWIAEGKTVPAWPEAARPDPAQPAGLAAVEALIQNALDAAANAEQARLRPTAHHDYTPTRKAAEKARNDAHDKALDAVRALLTPAAGVGALVDKLIREVRDHEATMWFAGKRDLATASDDEYAARTALDAAIAAKDREIAALRGRVAQLTGEIVLPTAADRFRRYALSIAVHDWPSTQPAADVERRVEQIEWQITGMFCAEARPYLDRALKAEEEIAALRRDPGAGVGEGSGYVFHVGEDGVRLMSDHGDQGPDWTLALVGEVEDRVAAVEEIRRDLAKGEAEGRPGRAGGEGA